MSLATLGYDEGQHPRDEHGQWVEVGAGGSRSTEPAAWHQGRYQRYGGEEMVAVSRNVPTGHAPSLRPYDHVWIGEHSQPAYGTQVVSMQVPARELIRGDEGVEMRPGGEARWVPRGHDPSLARYTHGKQRTYGEVHGLRSAQGGGETAVHAAADAHLAALLAVAQYAFKAGLRSVNRHALKAAIKAQDRMGLLRAMAGVGPAQRAALEHVLPQALHKVVVAGGQAGMLMLHEQMRAAAFNPDEPRDERGQWTSSGDPSGGRATWRPGAWGGTLYHGTERDPTKTAVYGVIGDQPMFLTTDYAEAHSYAMQVHRLGAQQTPGAHVLQMYAKPGKTVDVNGAVDAALGEGDDPEVAAIAAGRAAGADYVTYEHPSGVPGKEGPQHVVVALHPRKSLQYERAWKASTNRALAIHDVSDEPRDDHGRWTKGGVGEDVYQKAVKYQHLFPDPESSPFVRQRKGLPSGVRGQRVDYSPHGTGRLKPGFVNRFDFPGLDKSDPPRPLPPVIIKGTPAEADTGGTSTARLPEYKQHVLNVMGMNPYPLKVHDIVDRLRASGFKAMPNENRHAGVRGALDALTAKGLVQMTTNAVGTPVWKLTIYRKMLEAHEDDEPDAMKHAAGQSIRSIFTATSQEAIQWVRDHGAQLVKDISDTTEQTIRDTIEGLMSGDLDWPDAEGELTDAVGDEDRALLIARTETMKAANEGLAESWDQAIDDGLLTGDELKQWIATDDDRVCDICGDLDGEIVALDDDFSIGEDPPAHPNCRCTMGIVAG